MATPRTRGRARGRPGCGRPAEIRALPCRPMREDDEDQSDKRRRRKSEESGRPKDHVAVRLSPDLVTEVHALIPEMSTDWHQATISDVLRMLIIKGLHAHKQEKALESPTK